MPIDGGSLGLRCFWLAYGNRHQGVRLRIESVARFFAPWFLLLLGGAVAQQAMAQGANPEGFQTPSGYEIRSSKIQDFGAFAVNGKFDCLDGGAWAMCGTKHGPFDSKGHVRLGGKIETTSYRRLSERSTNYLLYLNFKRVIQQAGGRHVAQYRDGDEARGFFKHLLVIEKGLNKRWVLFDAYGANQKFPTITVITLTDVPNILSEIDLQQQLESLGFATLQLNFDNNMVAVRQDAEPTLNEVVKLMNSSTKLRLSVEGHTDNVGSPQANKDLSQRRADAILTYLVRHGVTASRLQSVGHGQEKPVADNRREEGRSLNRRVELVKLP
jgi:outer membrane protein OmpA-like peptidoglycan-associated protein